MTLHRSKQKPEPTERRRLSRHRRFFIQFTAGVLLLSVLGIGTWRDPHFWRTADQQGDRLLKQGKSGEAAKVYADPWRIGVAQYRNGDFEAAATTFARVPGATGAFDQGNAGLMHGNYDAAMASYDRALRFRPGWKEAEDNRALALARKRTLEAAGKDAEQEQTGQVKPDEITFDQHGDKQKGKPIELSGEPLSDEALRATWLRRVQTTPGDFLRAKFAYQASQSGRMEAGKDGKAGTP